MATQRPDASLVADVLGGNLDAFTQLVHRHRDAHMRFAVRMLGIAKSFGAVRANHDASLEVRTGEIHALVGENGAGKSTLVKLLVGLYTPVSGDIFFDDVPVKDIRYNKVRRQIGFVTQDTQLFAGTVRQNLQFIKANATEEEMLSALEKSASYNLLKSPKGLDTLLGEGGTKLSGGEKQRLSIARALLRDPQMLIFDEATASLDSITEEAITETIDRIAATGQQMIITIAHRLSTIMNADRIYVLEKGRIIETGNHDDLLQQKGLYYAMWRQQVGERDTAVINEKKDDANPLILISPPEL